MKKHVVGLLTAYAIVMTIIASHYFAEASAYHFFFDRLIQGKHGRKLDYPNLRAVYNDFSIDVPRWRSVFLEIHDLRGLLLIPGSVAILAAGVALPALNERFTQKPPGRSG